MLLRNTGEAFLCVAESTNKVSAGAARSVGDFFKGKVAGIMKPEEKSSDKARP